MIISKIFCCTALALLSYRSRTLVQLSSERLNKDRETIHCHTPGNRQPCEMDAEGAEAGLGFQPKEELLNTLMGIGFSRNAAIKGCYYTGNHNADLAAAWIIENQHRNLDGPLEEDLDFEDDEEGEEEEFPEGLELYKMVFVVNMELGMGVGKVGAQCAHAALALYRLMMESPARFGPWLMSWEQFGETKIVLKADNAPQMLDLAQKAESASLPNYIVHDAGRTQIAAGSQTVLGIFGKVDSVDSITGKLKLL